jgi:RHS repeat-associated protein
MFKNFFLVLTALCSCLGYSQKILTGYQAPQTVQDYAGIRMLPGFHANSGDGSYGTSNFIARIGDAEGSTPPPAIVESISASRGQNYIYSRTYRVPVTISNSYAPQMQAVTYFDGLGRPKQTIAVKATPTGQDLVTTIPYDGFGRQVDSWLPTPMASLNGGIQSGVESAAVGYYADQSPFTHQHLENSPLDRVEAVTQTSDAWQGNPITYKYDANKLNEVRKYIATFDYANFAAGIQMVGYYGANQLYKNTAIDEDGNSSIEFKNGEGQTVLVRKVLSLTPNSGVAPDNPELGVQFVDTYYVYNDYNQLAYVIPPLAVAAGNVSAMTLENLCYQYIYDGRNRLVEKKLPGKGWEYMVYDRADRLILTQDANMRPQQKWLLTKYDKFGRVAYTGITPGGDRATMQGAIKNDIITEERDGTGFTASGMDVLYTKGYYTAMDVVLSVNYYDTYPEGTPFPQGDEIQGVPILKDTFPAGLSVSTQSLPVASYVKNIEDDAWTTSYSFYDRKGRVIGTHAYNHLGGYTKTESVLDFTGVPQHTYTYHKRLSSSQEVQIKERFEYNQYSNALEKHYHEVVGKTPEELLSDNTYDEIGQLIKKKVGNNIQEVDYTYNIRGWMTGINSGNIQHNPSDENYSLGGGKLFGYRIRYDAPVNENIAPKKFNGNISEVDWIFGDSFLKRYGYRYDSMNRLLSAVYQDPGATVPLTDINNERIEYDLNGNIKRLYRNAKHGKRYTPVLIDDLTYYYENSDKSNRLHNISDATGNSSGYPGGGHAITYDLNGNMTVMPDKGIASISYNYLNLPVQIMQNTNTTTYLYRADGVKLKKAYTLVNSAGTKVINTEYLDGFQYSTPNTAPLRKALEETDEATELAAKAGQPETFLPLDERAIADPGNPTVDPNRVNLSFFPTAEGYYDYENYRYIYQYKDHLGNVRVSYVKEGSSLKVMDSNEYYPFGLSFLKPGSPTYYDPLAIPYNYKYNGKELQETGMYDYGARMYMPDIARWGVIDELAEKSRRFSPYTYALDNPILFVDPDGREAERCCGWIKEYAKGAWSAAGNMVKGVANSNVVSQVRQGIGEAGKVYNAYQKGGVSAAVSQYGKSVYETSGAKAVVETGKAALSGDPRAIGAAVTTAVAIGITHKATSTGTKAATMGELSNSVKNAASDLKASGHSPATVVGAELNGQTTIATSGTPPTTIAPQLEGAVSELGGIGTKTASGNTVGCCAEFNAGNQLLLNNPSATPGQINFTEAIRPRTGQTIPMCENCQKTFDK